MYSETEGLVNSTVMSNKMKILALALFMMPTLSFANNAFEIEQCIIKNGSNSEKDILKIVSVQKEEYITFSYFLSNGKLVQGQDYGKQNITTTDKSYSKVACPKHEGTFSPEKYLDKNS